MKEIENFLIPLNRNFMFIQVFYYHDGVKRLERFISDYFELEYEKVKGNIILLPRDQEQDKKFQAETQVDLLLKYEGNYINIELNNKNSEGIKERNLVYLHKIEARKYKKGDKYNNIKGNTIQINLNNYSNESDKLVSRYRLYEEDSCEIFSDSFRIDVVDITKTKDKNYKCKNEWEEKMTPWFMLLNANNVIDFKNICDKILPREESERFVDVMEELSSDEDIIRLENDAEMLRNTIISETRQEGLELGKKEGLELGKKEGIKQGIKEEKLEIAKNMLNKNIPLNDIAEITGLSLEEINKLK